MQIGKLNAVCFYCADGGCPSLYITLGFCYGVRSPFNMICFTPAYSKQAIIFIQLPAYCSFNSNYIHNKLKICNNIVNMPHTYRQYIFFCAVECIHRANKSTINKYFRMCITAVMVQRYPTRDKQGCEKWCIQWDVSSRIAFTWFRFWTYSTFYRNSLCSWQIAKYFVSLSI